MSYHHDYEAVNRNNIGSSSTPMRHNNKPQYNAYNNHFNNNEQENIDYNQPQSYNNNQQQHQHQQQQSFKNNFQRQQPSQDNNQYQGYDDINNFPVTPIPKKNEPSALSSNKINQPSQSRPQPHHFQQQQQPSPSRVNFKIPNIVTTDTSSNDRDGTTGISKTPFRSASSKLTASQSYLDDDQTIEFQEDFKRESNNIANNLKTPNSKQQPSHQYQYQPSQHFQPINEPNEPNEDIQHDNQPSNHYQYQPSQQTQQQTHHYYSKLNGNNQYQEFEQNNNSNNSSSNNKFDNQNSEYVQNLEKELSVLRETLKEFNINKNKLRGFSVNNQNPTTLYNNTTNNNNSSSNNNNSNNSNQKDQNSQQPPTLQQEQSSQSQQQQSSSSYSTITSQQQFYNNDNDYFIKNKLNELNEKIDHYEEENLYQQNTINHQNKTISRLEKEKKKLVESENYLISEKSRLERENLILQQQNETTSEAYELGLKNFEEEKSRLKESINNLQFRNNSMNQELTKKKHQIQEYENDYNQLVSNYESLKNQLDILKNQDDHNKEHLKELTDINQEFKLLKNTTTNEKEDLLQQINSKNQDNENLRLQIEKQNQVILKLRNEKDDILMKFKNFMESSEKNEKNEKQQINKLNSEIIQLSNMVKSKDSNLQKILNDHQKALNESVINIRRLQNQFETSETEYKYKINEKENQLIECKNDLKTYKDIIEKISPGFFSRGIVGNRFTGTNSGSGNNIATNGPSTSTVRTPSSPSGAPVSYVSSGTPTITRSYDTSSGSNTPSSINGSGGTHSRYNGNPINRQQLNPQLSTFR